MEKITITCTNNGKTKEAEVLNKNGNRKTKI